VSIERCSAASWSASRSRFVVASCHHDRTESLQAVAGEVAPLENGEPGLEGRRHGVGHGGRCREEDRRAGRTLGLASMSAAMNSGSGRIVSDDHDLTRAGDGIDRDVAEDVFLRQGHEQVARAHDRARRAGRPSMP